MELLNPVIEVPDVWTQVYTLAPTATISITGGWGNICQSSTAPDNDLIGLPIFPFNSEMPNGSAYTVTEADVSPVYIKALKVPMKVIVNA
jgi:hypothetical protein